jgi:hypothetical protein
LAPPLASVCRSTSGLVAGKFEGAIMSSSWRDANSTTASCWRLTPGTPVVALCHHCCCNRNAWLMMFHGHCRHASATNRLSCGSGSMQGGPSSARPARPA